MECLGRELKQGIIFGSFCEHVEKQEIKNKEKYLRILVE